MMTPGRRRRKKVIRASPRCTQSSDGTLAITSESSSSIRRSRSSYEGMKEQSINNHHSGKLHEEDGSHAFTVPTTLSLPSPTARGSLQGERAGIKWTIVFDTPLSHGNNKRMKIVTGIETYDYNIKTPPTVEPAIRMNGNVSKRIPEVVKKKTTSVKEIKRPSPTKRRSSGEKKRGDTNEKVGGIEHNNDNNKKDAPRHPKASPRKVSGEANNEQHVRKETHALTGRYFTRSMSDSERSDDDDDIYDNGGIQSSNVKRGDDPSIDPLAGFLPRAIDDSIYRRQLVVTATQESIDESQLTENSGLEVRPSRRGRRNKTKQPCIPTSQVQKGSTSKDDSYTGKAAAAAAYSVDYGASKKSFSSTSDTSSYDTNGVSATFMQFTLNEKGFVQTLSKDKDIESESTEQLAKAVAESSVPHLPMYSMEDGSVSELLDPERNDDGDVDEQDDAHRHARPEHGTIKSRFNQIGRKLRHVQRSLSGEGVDTSNNIMKSDARKNRNFLKVAHASFMRPSTSDDGGFCDELNSEHCDDDDIMLER